LVVRVSYNNGDTSIEADNKVIIENLPSTTNVTDLQTAWAVGTVHKCWVHPREHKNVEFHEPDENELFWLMMLAGWGGVVVSVLCLCCCCITCLSDVRRNCVDKVKLVFRGHEKDKSGHQHTNHDPPAKRTHHH